MFNIRYMVTDVELQKTLSNFMQQHYPNSKHDEAKTIEEAEMNIFFIEINDDQMIKKIMMLEEKLKKEAIRYEFVFMSRIDAMVFKLLIYKPLYFIRESLLDDDLLSLKKILDDSLTMMPIITVKSGNAIVRLDIKKILFIESFGHYIVIHTQYGQYKTRDKISSFQSKVKGADFIRTHKSYIVNMTYVDKVFNDYVSLVNALDEIPISRNFKKDVLEGFHHKLSNQNS